jgi:hypothetical protein
MPGGLGRLGFDRVRCASIAAFIGVVLALDTLVDTRSQLLLGAATWIALVLVCRSVPPELRAQAALVVVVATCAEITGSIIWGVYTYRLENLPTFVPPGHGLVYLCGVSLAGELARYRGPLVWTALTACVVWAAAGITVLTRTDVGGALGAVLLGYFLLRGRAPAIYAGVFLVVAALELYGTAIGTWTWHETIPGTGIPDGNPPSGVASGYVFFDVVALALAPSLLAQVRRARRSRAAPSRPLPDPARSA